MTKKIKRKIFDRVCMKIIYTYRKLFRRVIMKINTEIFLRRVLKKNEWETY